MNELTFLSSVMCFIPVVYIARKFYHLNKGIDRYALQMKSLNGDTGSFIPVETFQTPQPNLTLIHCQKCSLDESIELPKVVSQ